MKLRTRKPPLEDGQGTAPVDELADARARIYHLERETQDAMRMVGALVYDAGGTLRVNGSTLALDLTVTREPRMGGGYVFTATKPE